MRITVDADNQTPDRKCRTLYASETLYKHFQKECGDTAPSQVFEALMKVFVESKQKKSG